MRTGRLVIVAVVAATLGAMAPAAYADEVYGITVNTSSVLLQQGYIDMQLDPSTMGSQAATAVVSDFMTDGVLDSTAPYSGTIGDASGTLPGTISFDNGQTTNDYTDGITFGTTITFNLILSGDALNNPNGEAGGSFYLDFFDPNGNYFFAGDPTMGDVLEMDVNGDGTVTTKPYSVVSVGPPFTAATPEPASILLFGTSILGFAGVVRRRIRR